MTPHPQLRVKVSACLCRFGDQQGVDELIRLARDGDWSIRHQAIEAMGLSGQTRFVETLAQLGWTEKQPSVQRVLLQSLDQLVPAGQRPNELRENLTTDRQLEAWAAWWNRQQANKGVQTVGGTP
jgi:HEAT repeat protein